MFQNFLKVLTLAAATLCSGPAFSEDCPDICKELDGFKFMPPLVGASERVAGIVLTNAGIAFDLLEEESRQDIGDIVRHYPAHRGRIPPNTKVLLVVSTGVEVPNIVGLSPEQAEVVVDEKSGLPFELVKLPENKCDQDVVFRQQPKGLERVNADSTTVFAYSGQPKVKIPKLGKDVAPILVERYVTRLRELGFTDVKHTVRGPGAAPRTEPGYCPFVKSQVNVTEINLIEACVNDTLNVNEWRSWGVYDCR